MRDIGKNIKAIRTQKNITQDELAEKLFVTRQTISNYETGRSRPDVEMLIKIGEVLSVDIQELLYGPKDSADRKKRILWAAGIGLAVAVLDVGMNLGMQYTSEYGKQTFIILPNMIMGIFVRPAYFVLLGLTLTVCCRLLMKPYTLSPVSAKWIRRSVAAFGVFYLLCQFPWMFGFIKFPGFWVRLCSMIAQALHSHFWFFLLPGAGLGLCVKLQRKNPSDA